MFLSKCAAKPLIYDMPIIGTLQLIILRIYNILLYPYLALSHALFCSPARMRVYKQGLRIWFLPWHASTQPGLGFSVIDRVCIVVVVVVLKNISFSCTSGIDKSHIRMNKWISYVVCYAVLCCVVWVFFFHVWIDGSRKTILNFPFALNMPNRTEVAVFR